MADMGADHKSAKQMNARGVVACGYCGLIQEVNALPDRSSAKCTRCGLTLTHSKPNSLNRTLALALSALILYFPANLAPILKGQYVGAVEQSKIFDGIAALFQKGNYLVAGLVFTTSIVAPGIKIVGLLLLCLTIGRPGWQKFRTLTYKIIQISDPWNMLPVTLLAMVVALVELGMVATVEPKPGLFAFAGMVILTICASASFDPRLIWDENEGGTKQSPTH